MNKDKEIKKCYWYLNNLLNKSKYNNFSKSDLLEWVENELSILSDTSKDETFEEEDVTTVKADAKYIVRLLNNDSNLQNKKKLCLLAERLKKLNLKKENTLEERFGLLLGKIFLLNDIERDLFILILEINNICFIESMCEVLLNDGLPKYHRGSYGSLNKSLIQLYAALLGINKEKVIHGLSSSSKLITCGLIKIGTDSGDIFILNSLLGIIKGGYVPKSKVDFIKKLIGKSLLSSLQWSDFSYMQTKLDLMVDVLKKSVLKKEKGINIMLYGASGTGKTELAKLLANQCGLEIYSAGETDGDGNEPCREERSDNLKILQTLLWQRANACILFDEAEDFFPTQNIFMFFNFKSKNIESSKVYLNRLLENNAVPIIWTTNNIKGLDSAILRRMTLAIEMSEITGAVNVGFIKKECERQGIKTQQSDLERLAQEYKTSPAVIANAFKVANITNGDMDKVRLVLDINANAMGYQANTINKVNFNTALINSDFPLESLLKNIIKVGRYDFSLCLYGAPGTGKSAFARHLAETMNLEVLHYRASDLLSKYVGESERNIAQAFKEARSTKKLLIFDEADSLLWDRKKTSRSWEATQVNEMLTWMENHPHPFICTTNLMDNLDEASLRRFTFKVKYNFLNEEQKFIAFEQFFACTAPRELSKISNLTPADFAIVKKIADFSTEVTLDYLLMLLKNESQTKQRNIKTTSIGFQI